MQAIIKQLSIITLLCLSTMTVTYAAQPELYDASFSDAIISTINNKAPSNKAPSSTADMVTSFCNLMKSGESRKDQKTRANTANRYIYDPSQSLFMMVLCQDNKAKEYLQHTSISTYGIQCENTLQNGNDCQVPLYRAVHQIYNRIVSDMVDSMTAQAYGYEGFTTEGEESKEIEELSIAFIARYGTVWKEQALCESAKNCIIPQTRNRLESYLKKARQLIQSRKRIQQELPDTVTTSCSTTDKQAGTYTIIPCGLAANASVSDMHNMLSNELIRYTAFVQYYAYQLTHNAKLQPTETSGDVTKFIQKGNSQAKTLLSNHQAAVTATHDSMHHVAQIGETFPVHISLLAYYELVKTIRNDLAKIYTPLHQLYYKLRNVQSQS